MLGDQGGNLREVRLTRGAAQDAQRAGDQAGRVADGQAQCLEAMIDPQQAAREGSFTHGRRTSTVMRTGSNGIRGYHVGQVLMCGG
ncbi:MAG: hypothetical protein KatS3mg051_0048 [Anaerolineae bacterium]|nr:MAG: hypothetical protein KatS3mg051_0048 [Anaerolineae bacterium]